MTKQHTRMWEQERDMDVGLWKKGIGEVEKEGIGGIENERKDRTSKLWEKRERRERRGRGLRVASSLSSKLRQRLNSSSCMTILTSTLQKVIPNVITIIRANFGGGHANSTHSYHSNSHLMTSLAVIWDGSVHVKVEETIIKCEGLMLGNWDAGY